MAKRVLVIAGPTGSGKSAYAMELAKSCGGEIICADSRQIYQHMHIGTACPSPQDCAEVPHHGFERLDPRESYSAGDFVRDADAYVADILSRHKTSILVGGTGLYLRAWRFGLDDVKQGNVSIRETLEQKSLPDLYAQLKQLDPINARLMRTESVALI